MLANNVVICSKCGMRAHRGGQENSIKCRWCNTTYTGAGRRYYQRLNKKMKGTLRKKGGFPIAVLTENISNKGVMVKYPHERFRLQKFNSIFQYRRLGYSGICNRCLDEPIE